MQIQLNQSDIETAVRNYVSAMGITRQIDEIQFSVSRKGGQSIEAEIDLADCTGGGRVREAAPEPRTAEQAASKPEKAEPEAKAAEESEPTDTPPFRTEEASNDDTDETASDAAEDTSEATGTDSGKSLFS